MMNIRQLLLAALCAALPGQQAAAQAYPAKPIRLVMGYSVGSQPDVTVRVLVNEIASRGRLGQSIVVENRPGANNTIGAREAAKAPPDGYTLYFGGTTTDPVFVKNNAVDAGKEFDPVTVVGRGQYFLYARGNLPAKTFPDLVQHAKAQGGQLNFGGAVRTLDVIMQVLRARTGLVYTSIPYKLSTQTITAMLNGEADLTIGSAGPLFQPHLKTGALRAILCLSEKRSSLLPEAPSAGESGVHNLEASYSVGLWVPKGTPRSVVDTLNAEFVSVVRLPEIAERFRTSLGYEPVGSTPEEQRRTYEREVAFWAEAARLAGFEPQ